MGGQGGFALRGADWAMPDCNTSTYSNGKMGPNIRDQAGQWLTPNVPNVPNGGRSVSGEIVASKGMTPEGEKRTVGLESQVRFWPSPKASDGTKGGPNQQGSKGDLMLPSAAAQWPTPDTNPNRRNNKSASAGAATRPTIAYAVKQWPTPAARDHKSERGGEPL
jgi:hypothetical protein